MIATDVEEILVVKTMLDLARQFIDSYKIVALIRHENHYIITDTKAVFYSNITFLPNTSGKPKTGQYRWYLDTAIIKAI